ncbi:MAG: MMPL family transporter, partial [Planctomycetes bacterium]|nr:MMPL family transporter [Planctomycetota bacterium]
MDRLAGGLHRIRYAIWLVVLAGAAGLWTTGRPVTFNQSFEAFFPPDHAALIDYLRAKRAFGGDDFVFVAYEDEQIWTPVGMDRLRKLAERLAKIDGVLRVDSLDRMPVPWKVDAAARALIAEPLAFAKLLGGLSTVAIELRAMADQPNELAELRERICSSPLFRNLLVDPPGRTTAVVVRIKDPEETDAKQAIGELRRQADDWGREQGIGRVAVVGPPVLLADAFVSLEKDSYRLGLVAMVLMALTMLVGVRSPWWAVLPLVSGWTTWLLTQAFLNAFNMELTLSSGPIIVQTVVLCMPAASHLATHFQEALSEKLSPDDAARQTLVALWAPVAWCSLTAAAGYLALLTSTVRPVFQFGLTTAIANIAAGLLAYLLAAGAMQPPRWLRVATAARQVEQTASTVSGMTAWVLAHPGRTLVLFVT